MLQPPTLSATPQMSSTINPPQPIPFIPMVPPLASTFSPPVVPSVTSALVDNLINNNPTPVSNTVATTNTTIVQEHTEVKTTPTIETNANTEAPQASQLFDTQQNSSQAFITSEQQQVAAPPPTMPGMTENVNPVTSPTQNFVNTEGKKFFLNPSPPRIHKIVSFSKPTGRATSNGSNVQHESI